MVGRTRDWKAELGRWLKPFLDQLGHKARRQMCGGASASPTEIASEFRAARTSGY